MKSKTIILSLASLVTASLTIAYAQQQAVSYSSLTNSRKHVETNSISQAPNSQVSTNSGNAEIALARHLRQRGAKMYGAYWCPYCTKQKELFGRQAFSQITYIECDPRGQNPRPDLCRRANVNGFPTWEINGQKYAGMQSLTQLADITGYKGSRNFTNR